VCRWCRLLPRPGLKEWSHENCGVYSNLCILSFFADIDECKLTGSDKKCAAAHLQCENTAGSYKCKCKTGYAVLQINGLDACSGKYWSSNITQESTLLGRRVARYDPYSQHFRRYVCVSVCVFICLATMPSNGHFYLEKNL
jgi:hypothetical protein